VGHGWRMWAGWGEGKWAKPRKQRWAVAKFDLNSIFKQIQIIFKFFQILTDRKRIFLNSKSLK
jgi:hypothetical protein